jgi:hypothetical protein
MTHKEWETKLTCCICHILLNVVRVQARVQAFGDVKKLRQPGPPKHYQAQPELPLIICPLELVLLCLQTFHTLLTLKSHYLTTR